MFVLNVTSTFPTKSIPYPVLFLLPHLSILLLEQHGNVSKSIPIRAIWRWYQKFCANLTRVIHPNTGLWCILCHFLRNSYNITDTIPSSIFLMGCIFLVHFFFTSPTPHPYPYPYPLGIKTSIPFFSNTYFRLCRTSARVFLRSKNNVYPLSHRVSIEFLSNPQTFPRLNLRNSHIP